MNQENEVVLIALERHERYHLHNTFVEVMKRSEGAEATCEIPGLGYVTFSPVLVLEETEAEAEASKEESTPVEETSVSPVVNQNQPAAKPRKGIVSGGNEDDGSQS